MRKFLLTSALALSAAVVYATVPTEDRSISYECDGVRKTFPYTFKILNASDLKLSYTDVLFSTLDPVAITTGFTVTGVGMAAGGDVVLDSGSKCKNNKILRIDRTVDYTQQVSFRTQGTYLPSTHENTFDKIVMGQQQLRDKITDVALSSGGTTAMRSDAEPTTRPNGSPLLLGDIWFDSAHGNAIHVWDGYRWQDDPVVGLNNAVFDAVNAASAAAHAAMDAWNSATTAGAAAEAAALSAAAAQGVADAAQALAETVQAEVNERVKVDWSNAANIPGSLIANNSIGNAALSDLAVTTRNLAAGSVTGAQIVAGAVGVTQLSSGSVTAAKLGVTIGGTNWTKNSSFEVDSDGNGMPDFWYAYIDIQSTALDSDARYGAKSLLITCAGANTSCGVGSDGRTTPGVRIFANSGTTITVSGYFKAPVGYKPYLVLKGWDAETGGSEILSVSGAGSEAPGVWQRHTFTYTTNIDAWVIVVPRIIATGGGVIATGTQWRLDGVQLEMSDVATAYAPRNSELLPGTVGTTELAVGAVTTGKLAAGAVTANELGANSVVAGKIQAGVIGASELAANAVIAGKIATDAVTSNTIAANSITSGKIIAGAIGTPALAALAVTTANLAANSVTANKLVLSSNGAALSIDPGFLDTTAWVPMANGRLITITDGKVGMGAAHSIGSDVWVSSAYPFPFDPTKTYRVKATARRGPSATGGFYLAVRLFDSAGAEIAGDGTWWYYPVINNSLTTSWQNFTGTFGGVVKAFPANARTMAVGAILSYGSGVPWMEVQDLRIEEAVPASLIVDGAITTAKLNFSPVFTTSVVATINASTEGIRISGNKINIDGTVIFSSGYDPTTKATPSDVSTAQTSAINTAAADATTKANTAQSNATTAAAIDATSKANTAQSNAQNTVAGWYGAGSHGDSTKIDGGRIYTGTILADAINAEAITSDKIKAGTITTGNLYMTYGDNLFPNGTSEIRPPQYASASMLASPEFVYTTSSIVYSGSVSRMLLQGQMISTAPIPATEGDAFLLSAFIYKTNTPALTIRALNATGGTVGTAVANVSGSNNTWFSVRRSYVTPAGTASVVFELSSTTGTNYFDNIFAGRAGTVNVNDAPSTKILTNTTHFSTFQDSAGALNLSLADTGWAYPTLTGGTNIGSPQPNTRYRRIANIVYVQYAANRTGGDGSIIFNLPAGNRPSGSIFVGGHNGTLRIDANGDVVSAYQAVNPLIATISFPADQ